MADGRVPDELDPKVLSGNDRSEKAFLERVETGNPGLLLFSSLPLEGSHDSGRNLAPGNSTAAGWPGGGIFLMCSGCWGSNSGCWA